MATAEEIAKLAAQYAELGWCVYPWNGSALVLAEEVHPEEGTTDHDEAMARFRANPRAAIAAFPGRSGLVEVLTIRSQLRWRSMPLEERIRAERTCWFEEMSECDYLDGGETSHLFAAPAGAELPQIKLAPGIWLSGGSEPIFLPPAREPLVQGYDGSVWWATGAHPHDIPPQPLPSWLLELALSHGRVAEAPI